MLACFGDQAKETLSETTDCFSSILFKVVGIFQFNEYKHDLVVARLLLPYIRGNLLKAKPFSTSPCQWKSSYHISSLCTVATDKEGSPSPVLANLDGCRCNDRVGNQGIQKRMGCL